MATALSDLIQTVRNRTNTENSQFVKDTELTFYINSSLAELDDLIVGMYEDYKMTDGYQTTITTGNSIIMPPDFHKSRIVEKQISGNWMTLKRYGLQDRNRYS